jgi:precorrin-6B methylase 2
LNGGNTLSFERPDGSLYFLWVSPPPVIDAALELAELKPGEMLYDLGSGDGRVIIRAAQLHSVRAVGVESHQDLIVHSRRRIEELGLQDRVSIRAGDFHDQNLDPADVVMCFLDPEDLRGRLGMRLRDRLREGARVITVNYPLEELQPTRQREVGFSDSNYTIRLYR